MEHDEPIAGRVNERVRASGLEAASPRGNNIAAGEMGGAPREQ
jgi:hypothetical protein